MVFALPTNTTTTVNALSVSNIQDFGGGILQVYAYSPDSDTQVKSEKLR